MIKQIQELQQRELLLLLISGIFLILISIYMFIWEPLNQQNQLTQTKIKQYEWSLVELKYLEQLNQGADEVDTTIIGADQPLVVVIDIVLRKYNLYENLQRSQPIGNNTIRIEINEGNFNNIILSLNELESVYNLSVDMANISALQNNINGKVDASITLDRL
jgi:type II secretory pathway component PulM|tara:strand:+ start:1508 stop:1993 length:486 start_codon:yes stop_codon:yes gene_type:complete